MIVSAQNNRVTIAQNKLCSVLHTQWVKTFLDCAKLLCNMLALLGVLFLPGTVDISLFYNINDLDDKHEKIVRKNQYCFFCWATGGRIFKNKNKKYLGCSKKISIFSIQDH